MASITASLERSLQNCSLNHSHGDNNDNDINGDGAGVGLSSASSDTPGNLSLIDNNNNNNTLELNSHISLPYQWEQCLDLKTGEIYYINWMNGTKVKEDPRSLTISNSDCYFTEEDSSNYDSDQEGGGSSSAESSPSSSSRETNYRSDQNDEAAVLVVAGCKSCLMYFMLPKRVEQCPKCNALLLHFDRSENNGSSSPC